MAWQQYPRDIIVSTPLGDVSCAFTDAGHVSVTTDAHVNDSRPTVQYRGRDYLIHLHLYASRDWSIDPAGHTSVKSRDNWSDAPRTYRQAIIDTVSASVREYALSHPDILRAAEYADASNEVERLEKEASEASARLKALRAQLKVERARASRHAPTLESAQ